MTKTAAKTDGDYYRTYDRLPTSQQLALEALVMRHTVDGWRRTSSFRWDTPSGTEKVMKSLVKRGLAEIKMVTVEIYKGTRDVVTYLPTPEGREMFLAVQRARAERRRAAAAQRQRDEDLATEQREAAERQAVEDLKHATAALMLERHGVLGPTDVLARTVIDYLYRTGALATARLPGAIDAIRSELEPVK